MTWVFGILAAVFVLDALRMRGRVGALKVAPPAPDAGEPDGRFVVAEGVELDDTTRRAAGAFARAESLEVVDLVPGDLPVARALALAQLVDSRSYRANRLATGRTAGVAVLVATDVAERAEVEAGRIDDPVAFIELAGKLKRYACTSTDFAVVRDLRAPPEDPSKRLAITREVIGGATPFVLVAQLVVFAALVLGVALPGARVAGLAALGAFHLQPLLALAGTPIRSRDLWWMTLLRHPIEVYNWLRTVTGRWRPSQQDDPVEVRRPVYAKLLDGGDTSRFFEPRRETCPVCDGTDLRVHLRTTDLLQHKPGTFTLERCRDCGHIFQNPRLSLDGLDFYYKDFYDGLGEKGMEFIFGYTSEGYVARAQMLADRGEPARWLDVGGGHGHFCCVARDVWPSTTFDGLDLSESIDEAVRRRWVDHGYRGLFPELASEIEGRYDVVSMGHYLEHTLDPAAEIAAARTALAEGGHLLIEVPDPQSPLGKLLGRYWVPWFQPQHQHLLSRDNLDRLLREHGFTAVEWHRGEAHQRVDFLFAMFLLLDRIAPPTELPWRRPASVPRRLWRSLVWTVGAPFVLLARAADVVLDPAVRKLGMSNTYRVLARRN